MDVQRRPFFISFISVLRLPHRPPSTVDPVIFPHDLSLVNERRHARLIQGSVLEAIGRLKMESEVCLGSENYQHRPVQVVDRPP